MAIDMVWSLDCVWGMSAFYDKSDRLWRQEEERNTVGQLARAIGPSTDYKLLGSKHRNRHSVFIWPSFHSSLSPLVFVVIGKTASLGHKRQSFCVKIAPRNCIISPIFAPSSLFQLHNVLFLFRPTTLPAVNSPPPPTLFSLCNRRKLTCFMITRAMTDRQSVGYYRGLQADKQGCATCARGYCLLNRNKSLGNKLPLCRTSRSIHSPLKISIDLIGMQWDHDGAIL